MHLRFSSFPGAVPLLAVALAPFLSLGAEMESLRHYQDKVQPILAKYCFDCHADGANKGNISLDEFKSAGALVEKKELWQAVLKNVRANVMPPEKKPRPDAAELKLLADWVKADVFGFDPVNPDPGRVTLRRLNRVEYRNTIRDLTGVDFKVEEELPPDDTGYGFDNIGDVLSVSPMLLEKYMQVAERIVAEAVPRVSQVMPERIVQGGSFVSKDGSQKGGKLPVYDESVVSHTVNMETAGSYKLDTEVQISGQFDFDPGRCRLVFKVDDKEVWQQEYGWQDGKRFHHITEVKWSPGGHTMTLEAHPLVATDKKKNPFNLRIVQVAIQGPTEKEHWGRPKNFERFFTKDAPKKNPARREYQKEVLERFASKAFRRPVDQETLKRLMAIADITLKQPGKVFEDGVAQAMVAILASPKFLFRVEETDSTAPSATHPLVDEHALASRLSYFLWSTMPDEELRQLALRGELRKNLDQQVRRMLADKRSDAMIENFIGQWLQVRDVDGIDINSRVILSRDSGIEKALNLSNKRFEELRAKKELTKEENAERDKLIDERRKRFASKPLAELDGELRRAMRRETEMCFTEVVRENRSVLDLINANYTYLNERLAKHYGLTNVTGGDMRRVMLPEDSPRGGILTHGSVLVVTSNPTRTSPVKRGLFLLDNILGTPPPPAPPNIPPLEDSEGNFKDHEPSLRETLELHRSKPLCHSCHNRMDPLGLALENFNALGMWREKERNLPIDAAGKLITGEPFHDVRDIKKVIASDHRQDFYRCLTEKLLTYALGRGMDYYDVPTVDAIVEQLEAENGHFSALLTGIVNSPAFQKRRNQEILEPLDTSKPLQKRADINLKP